MAKVEYVEGIGYCVNDGDATDAIDEYCPCNDDWKNHGKYVKCVAQAVDSLDGFYSEDALDHVMSECGHKNKNKNKR